jgi:hypothetical protein
MVTLEIAMNESGYAIMDTANQSCIFEGIQSFRVACELHEMLLGEE